MEVEAREGGEATAERCGKEVSSKKDKRRQLKLSIWVD